MICFSLPDGHDSEFYIIFYENFIWRVNLVPETKNKSSAERKGFFSRRSKNTPKSEKKRNAAQNAAAELQLFEYFEQELD